MVSLGTVLITETSLSLYVNSDTYINKIHDESAIYIQLNEVDAVSPQNLIDDIKRKYDAEVDYSKKEDELMALIEYHGSSSEILELYK